MRIHLLDETDETSGILSVLVLLYNHNSFTSTISFSDKCDKFFQASCILQVTWVGSYNLFMFTLHHFDLE